MPKKCLQHFACPFSGKCRKILPGDCKIAQAHALTAFLNLLEKRRLRAQLRADERGFCPRLRHQFFQRLPVVVRLVACSGSFCQADALRRHPERAKIQLRYQNLQHRPACVRLRRNRAKLPQIIAAFQSACGKKPLFDHHAERLGALGQQCFFCLRADPLF